MTAKATPVPRLSRKARRFWASVLSAKLEGKLPHSQQFLETLLEMLEAGEAMHPYQWHECIVCHKPTKQHVFAHDLRWDTEHDVSDTFPAKCIETDRFHSGFPPIQFTKGGSIAVR